jgi:hypothetical protein
VISASAFISISGTRGITGQHSLQLRNKKAFAKTSQAEALHEFRNQLNACKQYAIMEGVNDNGREAGLGKRRVACAAIRQSITSAGFVDVHLQILTDTFVWPDSKVTSESVS